jgi:UDP-N-acetylglucosamine 2-epimerase
MSKHADPRFQKRKRQAVNYASLSKIMYTTSSSFKMEAMSSCEYAVNLRQDTRRHIQKTLISGSPS